jgi:hypothetical protein
MLVSLYPEEDYRPALLSEAGSTTAPYYNKSPERGFLYRNYSTTKFSLKLSAYFCSSHLNFILGKLKLVI